MTEHRLMAALWEWFASPLPALLGAVGAVGAVPIQSHVAVAGHALAPAAVDADELVVTMFRTEGRSLVRLARLFVDDRNAAEDLVQEAFIRLPAALTASPMCAGPPRTSARSY